MFDVQKADLWKRGAAYLLDIILISVAATGFAFLLSLVLPIDSYSDTLQAAYRQYEEAYSVELNISQEAYHSLSQQEQERFQKAEEALNQDNIATKAYAMVVQLSIVIISISLLLSYLLLEFVLPFHLKNGQTVGKKIFALAVMREDGVRISPLLLLVRTLLGKYTLGTMVPIMLVFMIFFNGLGMFGLVLIIAILLLQLGLAFLHPQRAMIHDLLSHTLVVDMPSQMIFDSPEALLQAKEEHHKRMAESKPY